VPLNPVQITAKHQQFNYIALATVLVATLPANGILLQNAITTGKDWVTLPKSTVAFAITDHLPRGSTAFLNPDGTISTYANDWQQIMPVVIGNVGSVYMQNEPSNTTCKGECVVNAWGIGFNSTCNETTIPYNMPDNSSAAFNTTVFSSEITWTHNNAYNIGLRTLWKDSDQCSGELKVRTCNLQLGAVRYRSTVNYNVTIDDPVNWSWVNQDQLDVLNQFFNDSKPVRHTPAKNFSNIWAASLEIPSVYSTSFGGIANGLASYYNSSVVVESGSNTSSLHIDGFYAQQIGAYFDGDKYCEVNFKQFGPMWQYTTPYDDLLDQIQQTLFFTSIWATSNQDYQTTEKTDSNFWPNGTWPKAVTAEMTQLISLQRYQVVWYWWGASCAVTLCIIIFILPTFYGFWTLARKTTLSPFETARAFNAPILQDQPMNLDTPTLLKTVGTKCVHRDLVAGQIVEKSES
jgi:hypothetical protein